MSLIPSPQTPGRPPQPAIRAPWLALWIFLAARVAAQGTGAPPAVPWWTLDGGGGSSTGGLYRVTGTIGQFDAAPFSSSGAGLDLEGGFWPLLEETPPFPPEIIRQPVSPAPVPEGGCVSMFIEATGVPEPHFQWRHNGRNLPGATNPILDLCLTNDFIAGRYDVLVFNPLGVVRSVPAIVGFQLDTLAFANEFLGRGVISTPNGRGGGNNNDATRLPGEPVHDGKRGGKSVWITYHAPATGILTVDTRGSTFDTLLAVYQGGAISGIFTPVVSDDDNGGFYCSLVRFRVVQGQDYDIALDGRAGDSGAYQVNWNLVPTDLIPPRIVRQPTSVTARPGQKGVLSVTVENGATFQWFGNGSPLKDDGRITGSQSPSLNLNPIGGTDAGTYFLVATTGGIAIQSETATVQVDLSPGVGPVFPSAVVFDKFADARDAAVGPPAASQRGAPAGAAPGGLSRGGPLLTRTDGYGTTAQESALCGVPGGASAWFYFQAETNGLVVLDTVGSSYDTVAGVFLDLTGDPDNLTPVACNDDAFASVGTSRTIFNANAGLFYSVVVDGKNGTGGTLITQVRSVGAPLLTATGFISTDTFEVQAAAEPGLSLVLEYAPVLGTAWTPLQTNSVPQAGTQSYTLGTSGAGALYFRARPDYAAYPLISSP